jgi:hypothetical protein
MSLSQAPVRTKVVNLSEKKGYRGNPARDVWTPSEAEQDRAVDAYEKVVQVDLEDGMG